jgi:dihydrodipicolinate reductase
LVQYDILIVGRGKLADELLHELHGPAISRVVRWDERDFRTDEPYMVVHAGSGRELDDVIGFCAETGSTLLELSTGDSQYPAAISFPVVICPNVNMQMLYFMAMVKQTSGYFRGQDIRIAESHQASKSTRPGTALYLARSLGIPETEIRSERDPKVQSEVLGIPDAFLDRHACHQIVIREPQVEIRLESRVLGKSAYASGLARIIGMLSGMELALGCHDVVDLVTEDIRRGFPDTI